MTYDFTTLIDRREHGSVKWRDIPLNSTDIVPFSVADMEFVHPPELREGLKKFTDEMIFGYTGPTDRYYPSVQDWMEQRHGFRPPREWFLEFPGVVPALGELVRDLTQQGDQILILTPVYYPFRSAVRANGRTLVQSELIDCGTTYDIDFDDVADKLARPEVTMMILCSPHNPVGRIWTREELIRLCELCRNNGVFLVADEIHADLILPGYTHTSVGTLTEFLDNTAICTAPSKTFNIAGLQVSNIFIPNAEKREIIRKNRGFAVLNAYGYKACELVYTECGAWLDALMEQLEHNRMLVKSYLEKNLPEIRVYDLQGTYLQWLDFRAFDMPTRQLEQFMHEAGWYCDEGYIFGPGGEGFERLNLACPSWVLERALERLKQAVRERGAER